MKEDKIYCVYEHKNKVNGKRYIGQSMNVNNRWGRDGKQYKRCNHFYNAIQKYGWDCFEHNILVDKLTKKEADIVEKTLISAFETTNPVYGYNLASGGANGSNQKGRIWVTNNTTEQHLILPEQSQEYIDNGYVEGRLPHSEETKEKLREVSKSRVYCDEWGKRISEALKGRVVSQETREKIRASAKQRTQSEETKQKLREINTEKHYSEETKAKHRKAMLGNTYAVGNTNVRGYVYITNGDIETRVPPEKVAEFEQKGYKRGRKPRK